MDTSGLPSSLVYAVSVLVFAYLSTVENSASIRPAASSRSDSTVSVILILRTLRAACVLSMGISGLAVLVSQVSLPRGMWIALVSLGVLTVAILIDRVSVALVSRFPEASVSWSRPLIGSIAAMVDKAQRMERYPNGTESRRTVDDEPDRDDPNEPVITEKEQVFLDNRERSMLRSILRLDESIVREVMAPRVDIVAVEVNTPLAEVAGRMMEVGHSRLPVYNEVLDAIEGVIDARSLLGHLARDGAHPPLKNILLPAFFTPESKRLDDLLEEFQAKRVQMAIVVDEYGGTEGLVTVEDLLEEIVGEIEDEFSSRHMEPQVVPVGDGELLVDAKVTMDYIADSMSVSIDNPGPDPIATYVYAELGRIPEIGDEVTLNGLQIKVISVLGRRIRKLRVSRSSST